jgi:hypothetical protein
MDDIMIQHKAETLVNNHVLVWAGVLHDKLKWSVDAYEDAYNEACIPLWERDESEPLDQWIVSPWLACELEERGEIVIRFAEICIWQRMTWGQAVYLDAVIQAIASK